MEMLLGLAGALGLVLVANISEGRDRWTSGLAWCLFGLNLCLGLVGAFTLLAGGFGFLLPNLDVSFSSGGAILLVTSVVGFLCLSPAVRKRLSKVMSIRPESPVHLTALILSFYLISWVLLTLSLVGGLQGLQASAGSVSVFGYVIQTLGLLLFSLLGVGLFTRRRWVQVVDRLGLSNFRWRSLLVASLAVVLLVAINLVVSAIWVVLDPSQADAVRQISDAMLRDFDSVGTIFLLAALSSVSEEMLFRGALQPRLGIPFTSLLFAATHLQYAISPATLVVFVIGMVLGALRRYLDTWAAILTHFGYNFGLLLLGLVARRLLAMAG
jgi:membrane protease YdiL (CAAX protease family)